MRRRSFLELGALFAAASITGRAGADDLADLRRAGVLRVGVSDDYAPFVKAAGGVRAGLDVDLAQRLARALGVRVEYVPFKWPDLSARLEENGFDVAASGVTMRADRLFFGTFSRPYAITGAVTCIRREDAARFADPSTLNAPGVRIAVNRGGHLANVARAFFPRATLELLGDNSLLFDRVTTRAADAAVSDSAEAHAAAKPELALLPPLTRDRKALYVRRDAPALACRLDEALFAYENDGSLARLRRKWLGDVTPAGWNPHLEAVLADVQLRLDLMPSVGATKRALGKPVEDKEQEARVLARVGDAARAAQLDVASVEALWRVLMSAAKVIQLAPVITTAAPTTLDALRIAIGGLDAQLLSTLKDAVPRVPEPDWQKGVDAGIRSELLPKELVRRLADALAGVRRAQRKAS
ncbi:MAG TPA: transporter substrate-binding domain-containing protein [Polyangiaceae bacterium]|nr:transporter substrate-binding domain-containing protein [Polyangiaceae bacterium]